jgi:outer membrane protein assembly factor BamE (lipoprotein component of BamABCDE complex)
MLKNVIISVVVLANMLIVGCVSQPVNNSQQGDRVTVGTVQKEIKVGMSAASVASVLGSPNIVTSDDKGGEVWIYDKISSNVSYSSSDVYATILLIGGSESSSNASSSQKTLTIIVKFDASKKVSSFKYHTSRF